MTRVLTLLVSARTKKDRPHPQNQGTHACSVLNPTVNTSSAATGLRVAEDVFGFLSHHRANNMSSRLALRLWAQTHVQRVFGKQYVLLESSGDEPVVLCFDSVGLACIVCEAPGIRPAAPGLPAAGGGHEPWPVLQLHRVEKSTAAAWFSWSVGDAAPAELSLAAAKEQAARPQPGEPPAAPCSEHCFCQTPRMTRISRARHIRAPPTWTSG